MAVRTGAGAVWPTAPGVPYGVFSRLAAVRRECGWAISPRARRLKFRNHLIRAQGELKSLRIISVVGTSTRSILSAK